MSLALLALAPLVLWTAFAGLRLCRQAPEDFSTSLEALGTLRVAVARPPAASPARPAPAPAGSSRRAGT